MIKLGKSLHGLRVEVLDIAWTIKMTKICFPSPVASYISCFDMISHNYNWLSPSELQFEVVLQNSFLSTTWSALVVFEVLPCSHHGRIKGQEIKVGQYGSSFTFSHV